MTRPPRTNAREALASYTAASGPGEDTETNILDLIADLLIVAHEEGLDLHTVASRAMWHATSDLDPADPFAPAS